MIKKLVWNESPHFAVAPFGLIFRMQEIKDGVRVSLIEEESELPLWSCVCQSKVECREKAQLYLESQLMPFFDDLADVDWNKAPDWANYFAIDQNGIAFWFNEEPYPDIAMWRLDYPEAKYTEAFRNRMDWRSTLLKRPK